MSAIIKVDSIAKQYRLGTVGSGTIQHDLIRWWDRVRGKENRFLKVGEANDRRTKGISDYVWALKDISFEVQPGEVLGIIGRNGAGKSTLLKILSRVAEPSTGRIEMRGRVASLLEVGTGMHPDLTGRENIYLNGAILGMNRKEIDRKLEEIIDFAGVERYIDTPVKRYSSGMHVRLGFAVAAHLEPEILIVDEVLAVGDAEFQRKCLGKMKEVSTNDGRTVLFVSHNMTAIENLCSRAILLENGFKTVDGNVSDVIDKYFEAMKQVQQLSLAERTDRLGPGILRMTDVFLEDTTGNRLDYLSSGNDAVVAIRISNAHPDQTHKSIVGSLAFHDERGQIVFLVRSNFTKQNFELQGETAILKCTIPKLPLANGTYSSTLFLGFGEHGVWDMVENAFELEVRGGDFFGTGQVGLPHLCKTLHPANWKLEYV